MAATWRWDHDRDALLAEEAAEEIEPARAAEESAKRRELLRARLTWSDLMAKRRFVVLEEWLAPDVVGERRRLFVHAIGDLASIGAKPNRRKAKPILRRLVEALNRIDIENGHFITTIEREALCEEIDEIAFLAGYEEGSVADEWRRW